MKLNATLNGNALCITKKDFINLAESPAFFFELSEESLADFKKFMEK